MRELWKDVEKIDEEEHRRFAYAGLQVSEVHDLVTGEMDPFYRVVRLAEGPTLLILLCDEARAFQIATDLASRRDWTKVKDWDGITLYPEQIGVISLYPGQAVPPSEPYLGDFDDVAFPPSDWAQDR